MPKGIKTLIGGVVLATAVTGCSVPHLADMSSSKPASSSTKKAAPSASPSPSAKPSEVAATHVAVQHLIAGGDLSNGSLQRQLPAGSMKLAVSYWTDSDPSTWAADRSTIVNLSAHIENGDKDHGVIVSRFVATMDDGTSVTTLSDDKGSFTLTPPYSYSSGLVVKAAKAATSATIVLRYDLLIQTAPNAFSYYRQSVLDTLHINFASKDSNND